MDYLVSTTWLSVTVVVLLLFMITGIWYIRPFKKWQYNRIMHVVCSVSFFAFIMYMHLGPHGYAVQFTAMQSNGKQLCLLERHERGDGDGGTSTWFRLYVLNLATGQRIYRMVVNSSNLLLVKPNSVVLMESKGPVEYDLTEGNEIKSWTKEEGFTGYPELSSGINSSSFGTHQSAAGREAYLLLTAMNGKKFVFDLGSEKLKPGDYQSPPKQPGYEMHESDVYFYPPNNGYYKRVYAFETTEGEIRSLIYTPYGSEEKMTYPNTFLQPRFVGMNDTEKFLIVKHYESLDHTKAVLTCVDFGLVKKWEIKQQQLEVPKSYNDSPETDPCLLYQQHLLVAFGGFVISINTKNGTVEWKTRL